MELELKNNLRTAKQATVLEAQKATAAGKSETPEYVEAGEHLTRLVTEAFARGYSVQEIGDAQNGF